jgi:hypothetical protein
MVGDNFKVQFSDPQLSGLYQRCNRRLPLLSGWLYSKKKLELEISYVKLLIDCIFVNLSSLKLLFPTWTVNG